MEILGKIVVKRNKRDRAKKMWLTIGLVAFIVTVVIELLLGNLAFLALIIPFLYLLNLRNNMDKTFLYKDVIITTHNNGKEHIIEISNCEYRNNILYSVRFIICNNAEIIARYNILEEEIKIFCTAKKVLFLENKIIPDFENQTYIIALHITLEEAKLLANELGSSLSVERQK